MYPKRMERVEVFLMRKDLQKVVDDLQSARIIQSIDVGVSSDVPVDPELLEIRSSLERIIDFLAPLETPLKGLKNLLKGDGSRFRTPRGDVVENSNNWLISTRKELDPVMDKVYDLKGDIEFIHDLIQRISTLSGLSVDLDTLSAFDLVRIRVGTTRRYEELLKAVEGVGGSLEGSLIDKKEGLHCVRVAYTRSMEKKIGEVLSGRLFTEMIIDVDEIRKYLVKNSEDTDILNLEISRLIPKLEHILGHLEDELNRILEKGTSIADTKIRAARAYLELVDLEIERRRYSSRLFKTRYTNRIIGWIEKERIPDLRDILQSRCPSRYHIDHRPPTSEEISEGIVPTKLTNGWLGTMFEPITNTFSIPKYDEIDPSIWISIPFIFFFGLMLGDAGYGLLIMLLSGLVLIMGSKRGSIRMTAWMGFLMGLATTLSGIWMGAFFGDLIPRVLMGDPDSSLYSATLFGYNMPYDTLKDPMLLFQISLYIGLAQLNLGIILLGLDKLFKKDLFGFFKGTISWILIQVGAIIFVGAMLIGWWELNTTLTAIGGLTFVSGVGLLAIDSKGMVLFDVEGYLGDLISYTRILALGLSTFGLAMAFNIVGKMLVDIHVAMIPIVILLLVFLHIFNLLLQALGAAVHSLRLQFVEFFGRFYEGGGVQFDPFGMERIHTSEKTRRWQK